MKSLLIFLVLLVSVPVAAQYTFGDPVTGRAYKFEKYSGVRGTPFLFTDWLPGFAMTSAKVVYKDVKLKLDICDNVLFFNFRDQPFEFKDGISQFTLTADPSDSSTYLTFRKGYSGDGIDPYQFAQVLAEGQITFLKKESKRVQELNEINAGLVKSFTLTTKYFALKKGEQVLPIKLAKNDVTALLGNNTQVLDYIKEKGLSFKKEKDVIEIFKYFNSLPPQ